MADTHNFLGRLPYNFAGVIDQNFESAEVVVLPIPYDATLSYVTGAREGPFALINASRFLEFYDHELGKEISEEVKIYTLDELDSVSVPEDMQKRIESSVGSILKAGKFPVILGGEHSITIGALRAIHQKYPKVSVLQLDAHDDLWDEFMGSKYSHACPMRRAYELLPKGSVVQVGIRNFSADSKKFLESQGTLDHMYFAEDVIFNEQKTIKKIVSQLTDEVYISLDLDVFDPSGMPGVGTPEPGGLNWYQVLNILREVCKHKKIIGFDVVELKPISGSHYSEFTAAKLVYKMIGYSQLLNKK